MKKILIPLILALFGAVGGAAAGYFLKPPPEPEPCLDEHGAEIDAENCAPEIDENALGEPYNGEGGEQDENASEYVELDRQFIVPVVDEDRVASLIVLTLSIEVEPGKVDAVFAREPKIRDALLRTLFEHAYTGGFDGDFTADYVMKDLRRNLLIAARKIGGGAVRDVLVVDIIKQAQ